jgi:glycosyltransferase involved in cell wall biosynthesis
VTVLIGAFNNAPTLPEAIGSILRQTVETLELIVVDDGSTDDTATVVAGVDDPRLRYLPLAHTGIAGSLNRGIAEAQAPIVAIQDADDWSEPQRLERSLDVLDREPDVAVVGGLMREVDPEGRELVARTAYAVGDVNGALMRFNPLPNSCAAFRREVVQAAGGYDPRYLYASEYDLWLRISERHRVVVIDQILATRRMSGVNVAARKERDSIAESIAIRLAALRRRRTLRGAGGLVLPSISYVTPLLMKRALRRRLGQAP